MLRWLVDAATVLTVGAFLAGGWYLLRQQSDQERLTRRAAAEVTRFQAELSVRAAAGLASEVNPQGWPTTVDSSWFGDNAPRNALLSGGRPWVEVAPPSHKDLTHPPARVALDASLASFWYNPYRGVVRARVPMKLSEARTLELYNAVNRSAVTSLYEPPPEDLPPIEAMVTMGPPLPPEIAAQRAIDVAAQAVGAAGDDENP